VLTAAGLSGDEPGKKVNTPLGGTVNTILELQELPTQAADAPAELELASTISVNQCTAFLAE
jgi:hypothetical protein